MSKSKHSHVLMKWHKSLSTHIHVCYYICDAARNNKHNKGDQISQGDQRGLPGGRKAWPDLKAGKVLTAQ